MHHEVRRGNYQYESHKPIYACVRKWTGNSTKPVKSYCEWHFTSKRDVTAARGELSPCPTMQGDLRHEGMRSESQLGMRNHSSMTQVIHVQQSGSYTHLDPQKRVFGLLWWAVLRSFPPSTESTTLVPATDSKGRHPPAPIKPFFNFRLCFRWELQPHTPVAAQLCMSVSARKKNTKNLAEPSSI